MATRCFSAVQGLAVRATKLDFCCNPAYGDSCGTVVSESFVTFSATAEIEEPTEILVKTAAGRICINDLGVATLKRYNVELSFCEANPDLLTIAAGTNPVLGFNGEKIGYSTDSDLGGTTKWGLELWSRVPTSQCEEGEDQAYVYFLFPCLTNGRLGDVTIEDGAVSFDITAQAIPSSNWGVGPYDVVEQNGLGTAGPLLAAIPDDTGYVVFVTGIAPPDANEVECGCTPLLVNS